MAYKQWTPNTFYNRGEKFTYVGINYKVIEDFYSTNIFRANDSRITVFQDSGGGQDSTTIPSNSITLTGDTIETIMDIPDDKLIRLYVNNVVYFSSATPPYFHVVNGKIVWEPSVAGFSLDSGDILFLEF